MIEVQSSSSADLVSKGYRKKQERDAEILKYGPLVKNVVERIAIKLPRHIDKEDLIHVGIIGLMSALERFDETRNVRFETFAKFRIRGAILDELRSRDVLSRSTRNKDAQLSMAALNLQKQLGRAPDEEEMADYLGITLEEYYKLLDDAKGVSILSSDDLPPEYCDRHRDSDIFDTGGDGEDPLSIITTGEEREILRRSIESLPEKEKVILSLYYYEEMTLKEIGRIMSLTESRICQIHSQAIVRLRGRLKEWREEKQ
ncbi:MAG: FliA/WhiG family RNA polymerase sigma factor [Deltaproteobacteria bacterium]|nr:FliA/WhiG family RNA polymerase sigma factor [Deltaproteobacteria bacterium]